MLDPPRVWKGAKNKTGQAEPNTRLGELSYCVLVSGTVCLGKFCKAERAKEAKVFPFYKLFSVSHPLTQSTYMNIYMLKKKKTRSQSTAFNSRKMHQLHTCVLRSWPSCLRRSVAFCCRPLRWSCICKRLTLLTALEGGGGIRARGADGVLAANHRAGQHEGST